MNNFSRIKNGKSEHHVDESVDLDSMALQCYESVPNVFFDLKFYFNWEALSKSREEINEY
jgi:hypothetical protein